ncbi:hypothetical protein ACJIZ3_000356 [Penstemon smallii]|uniref:Uncharacterized protein n=1 Tax=Penstemon smallii TaxID=265156 RepID=A0ABD3R5B4_9LAMI
MNYFCFDSGGFVIPEFFRFRHRRRKLKKLVAAIISAITPITLPIITKGFLLFFLFIGWIAIPPDSPSSGKGSGLAAARLGLGLLNLKISRPFNRALAYKGSVRRIDGKTPLEAYASIRHRPRGGVHFLRRAIRRRLGSVIDPNIVRVRVKAEISSEYVVIVLIPYAKHAAIILNFDVGTTDV